jgi:hypothetical protein
MRRPASALPATTGLKKARWFGPPVNPIWQTRRQRNRSAAPDNRRAPRDLWDSWALSRISAIDAAAVRLYRQFAPTNQPPGGYLFGTAPSDNEWRTQLASQTRLSVDAANARAIVREAWARVVAGEYGNHT